MENYTDEELRTFAEEHLFYEISMLLKLYDKLEAMETLNNQTSSINSLSDVGKELTVNPLVEAYGVHFRILLMFLRDSKENKDNNYSYSYATHYVTDTEQWKKFIIVNKKQDDSLDRLGSKISYKIVHLAYGRTEKVSEKEWLNKTYHNALINLLIEFVDKAKKERLGPKIIELKKALLDALD